MSLEKIIKSKNWIPTKKFISETLLIAFLTGVAYCSAFVYQFSYLNYFGIPIFFVDINLVTILMVVSAGLLIFLSLVQMFSKLILKEIKSKIQRLFMRVLMILLLIIFFTGPLFMIAYSLAEVGGILSILILIAATIGPLLVARVYKSKKIKNFQNDSIFSRAEKTYGSYPALFFVVVFFFLVYCFAFGLFVAKTTTYYLGANNDQDMFLISTYRDSFVAAKYNSNTRSFDSITLLSQNKISDNSITFSYKKIFPLYHKLGIDK